jgi:hypothetical protein
MSQQRTEDIMNWILNPSREDFRRRAVPVDRWINEHPKPMRPSAVAGAPARKNTALTRNNYDAALKDRKNEAL